MTTRDAGSTGTSLSPAGVGLGVITESVLPGGSNLIKGDLATGGLHLLMAMAAGALFGPIGVLAIRANSIAKATTGRGVLEQVMTDTKS